MPRSGESPFTEFQRLHYEQHYTTTPFHHRRQRGRRQEHADRAPVARLEIHIRGSALESMPADSRISILSAMQSVTITVPHPNFTKSRNSAPLSTLSAKSGVGRPPVDHHSDAGRAGLDGALGEPKGRVVHLLPPLCSWLFWNSSVRGGCMRMRQTLPLGTWSQASSSTLRPAQ